MVFRRKTLFWKVILSLVQINNILMLALLYKKHQDGKVLQSKPFKVFEVLKLSWGYEDLNDKTWLHSLFL